MIINLTRDDINLIGTALNIMDDSLVDIVWAYVRSGNIVEAGDTAAIGLQLHDLAAKLANVVATNVNND